MVSEFVPKRAISLYLTLPRTNFKYPMSKKSLKKERKKDFFTGKILKSLIFTKIKQNKTKKLESSSILKCHTFFIRLQIAKTGSSDWRMLSLLAQYI